MLFHGDREPPCPRRLLGRAPLGPRRAEHLPLPHPERQYFRQVRTRWAREREYLEPLALEAAIRLFWKLPDRALRFEDAFPRVTPLDGVTNIDLARIVMRLRGAQRLRLERELPGCEWLSARLASSNLELDEFITTSPPAGSAVRS